jgi:PhnB protein
MNVTLNPYLNFNGKSREGFAFYQSVFGGELTISTFGDQHVPDAPADSVMHAQLTVDGHVLLMGSDGMGEQHLSGFSLSLSGNDSDDLHGLFDKLADGGQVTKSLGRESWGDEFGMLTDRFGVSWMVNIATS